MNVVVLCGRVLPLLWSIPVRIRISLGIVCRGGHDSVNITVAQNKNSPLIFGLLFI